MNIRLEHQKREHAFWILCSSDFNSARHILRIINRYRRKDVRFYLLLAFVVTYVRPFTKNAGFARAHTLPTKGLVPKQMRDLHEELIRRRNQQFAHTDLTFRNPRISNWSRGGKAWFPMTSKGDDYEWLDARVPQLEDLVRAVEHNLASKLGVLEAELEALAALPL